MLVSCCPGGTASNVIAYLARADVALSVTLTALSTLLAVVMTPVLTALLAGSRIDVPAGGLLLSTVQVVILPVAAGAMLKWRFPRAIDRVLPIAPLVAIAAITLWKWQPEKGPLRPPEKGPPVGSVSTSILLPHSTAHAAATTGNRPSPPTPTPTVKRHSKLTPWRHRKLTPEETAYVDRQR